MAFYDLAVPCDAHAVVDENGRIYTYSDLSDEVNRFAEKLSGSRQLVFIIVNNNIATLVAYLACLRQSHVALLLHHSSKISDIKKLQEVYAPNSIIDTRSGVADLQSFHNDVHTLHHDISILLSTSGSTGSFKLVKLSRGNLQSNACSIAVYLSILQTDIAITSLPFCYSYGLSVINSHLQAGACIVMTQENIVSSNFWSIFREHKVNSFAGVSLSYSLLKQMRFEHIDLQGLRYMTHAGGRLDSQLWDYLISLSRSKGIDIFSMYGQTEATARIAYLPPHYFSEKKGSIGKSILGGRLELVDTEGIIINQPNVEGELIYYGDNVMMGYAESLSDLAKNKDTHQLNTGDLAYRDNDSFYYITGRLKRFIKIAGVRFNLDEVEHILRDAGFSIACAGRDDQLIVGLENKGNNENAVNDLSALIQQKLLVNSHYFKIKLFDHLPVLTTGKLNYQELLDD